MDNTTNPCVDFNKFACGGFERMADLKELPNPDTWDDARSTLRARVKTLIKQTEDRPTDFDTDKKVRHFYKACLSFHNPLNQPTLQTENEWIEYIGNVLEQHLKHTAGTT